MHWTFYSVCNDVIKSSVKHQREYESESTKRTSANSKPEKPHSGETRQLILFSWITVCELFMKASVQPHREGWGHVQRGFIPARRNRPYVHFNQDTLKKLNLVQRLAAASVAQCENNISTGKQTRRSPCGAFLSFYQTFLDWPGPELFAQLAACNFMPEKRKRGRGRFYSPQPSGLMFYRWPAMNQSSAEEETTGFTQQTSLHAKSGFMLSSHSWEMCWKKI